MFLVKKKRPQVFEEAAANLLTAMQTGLIPTPMPMQQVKTVEDMKKYLRQHGELCIHDDHVQMVQDEIRNRYKELGPEYASLRPEEVDQLVSRVKPMGVPSQLLEGVVPIFGKTTKDLDALKREVLGNPK